MQTRNKTWSQLRFSFGGGEWRAGPETRQIKKESAVPSPQVYHLLSCSSLKLQSMLTILSGAEEANEVTSDPEGRFFSFNIDLNSIFIMEKKGLPNHLAGLPFVDVPATLGSIITNLEDAGEVGR